MIAFPIGQGGLTGQYCRGWQKGPLKHTIGVATSALSPQDPGIPAATPGTHGYAQSKYQHAYPQLSHRLGTQPAAVRRPDQWPRTGTLPLLPGILSNSSLHSSGNLLSATLVLPHPTPPQPHTDTIFSQRFLGDIKTDTNPLLFPTALVHPLYTDCCGDPTLDVSSYSTSSDQLPMLLRSFISPSSFPLLSSQLVIFPCTYSGCPGVPPTSFSPYSWGPGHVLRGL